MSENKRRFTRVKFVGDACLETAGERFPARVLNLSLKGVLLEVPTLAEQQPGRVGTIRFRLGGSKIELCFHSLLAHHRGSLLGYQFDAVDLESMIHLRTLLEYNLGDAELIRAEVYRLAGD